jgi:hypothetical protein
MRYRATMKDARSTAPGYPGRDNENTACAIARSHVRTCPENNISPAIRKVRTFFAMMKRRPVARSMRVYPVHVRGTGGTLAKLI